MPVPDERVVADGAQLHEGVADALQSSCWSILTSLHLPFYQAAQRHLVS